MKTRLKLALMGTIATLTLPMAAQAQQWNQNQNQDRYPQDQQRRDGDMQDQQRRDGDMQDQRRRDGDMQDQRRGDDERRQFGGREWYGRHPGYARALADIRASIWQLSHQEPNNPMVSRDEQAAQQELRAAYDLLVRASVSDGQDPNGQPPADMNWGNHSDRLHRALDLSHQAGAELRREENNPQANNLRNEALNHLSLVSRYIGLSMRDSHRHQY